MQGNHIDVLIFPVNTFLEQDATKSILKYLRYSRGTGQAQVQYFECFKDTSEKCIEVGVAG